MSVQNEKFWKNRLQEYCQKNELPMPNYRVIRSPSDLCFQVNSPRQLLHEEDFFLIQADVEINRCWYRGDHGFTSKKDAEQSAAKTAYNSLSTDGMELQTENADSGQHMPEEYVHIEQFFNNMVMAHGGRIRKIYPPRRGGTYRIEIAGKYRYCENVQRHHKKNRVYLLIDTVNNVYYQKCYDPNCDNFQSVAHSLPVR